MSLLAILILVIAGFLLIFGLMAAPWQVLLLVLVIGLVGTAWLKQQGRLRELVQEMGEVSVANVPASSALQTPQALQENALRYRGAVYQSGSTAERSPQLANQSSSQPPVVAIVGKYRGNVWRKASGSAIAPATGGMEVSGKYRGCSWKLPGGDRA